MILFLLVPYTNNGMVFTSEIFSFFFFFTNFFFIFWISDKID
jgi:hypothetical protein